jgi:predicted nucleotidyltransferase
LNQNDVDYILVGGWVVGFYGYPRFTADIDVFISIEKKNIDKTMKAMQEFGVPSFDESMLTTLGHVFRIGRTPMLIEIINEISGIDFDTTFQHKQYFELADSLKVPIISLEDLIINKSSTNRQKDKADLEYLLKIQKGHNSA